MTLDGIRLVAFDADDTLWHNEDLFSAAHGKLAVALGMSRSAMDEALGDLELENIAVYGFGAKSFALSAIEFASTHARVESLPAIVSMVLAECRELLTSPVRLIGDPAAVLDALRTRGYEVAVITKGDYMVQSGRLRESGLIFDRSAIVAHKNVDVYDEVFRDWGVPAETVCMVGNSVLSDVLPVIALGGTAVHIPYPHVWRLEHAEIPAGTSVVEIAELTDLLGLLP